MSLIIDNRGEIIKFLQSKSEYLPYVVLFLLLSIALIVFYFYKKKNGESRNLNFKIVSRNSVNIEGNHNSVNYNKQ